jgi:hypothetical protein
MRGEFIQILKYATAKTACKGEGWAGNGGRLGMGDMSESNGAIPGTRDGSPGHPEGTHRNGYDIDIGYYQVNTADNRLRPVCDHYENGQEVYHCTSEPNRLDPWRTAFFIAALHESGRIRVIGVDGQVGPIVESAMDQLCASGWIERSICNRVNLAYETRNEQRGWYYFHHHHLHVSFSSQRNYSIDPDECLIGGCPDLPPVKRDPRALWTYHGSLQGEIVPLR